MECVISKKWNTDLMLMKGQFEDFDIEEKTRIGHLMLDSYGNKGMISVMDMLSILEVVISDIEDNKDKIDEVRKCVVNSNTNWYGSIYFMTPTLVKIAIVECNKNNKIDTVGNFINVNLDMTYKFNLLLGVFNIFPKTKFNSEDMDKHQRVVERIKQTVYEEVMNNDDSQLSTILQYLDKINGINNSTD